MYAGLHRGWSGRGLIPPSTSLARSQDRFESTERDAELIGWRPYRRRGGFWGNTWDAYWEYQSLRWSLAGIGGVFAGIYLLFNPSLFWAGVFLILVGAGWTYLMFRPRRSDRGPP